jgi:hypothetical protein
VRSFAERKEELSPGRFLCSWLRIFYFWFGFLFDRRECKRRAIVCGMWQILRFMKKTKIVCRLSALRNQ